MWIICDNCSGWPTVMKILNQHFQGHSTQSSCAWLLWHHAESCDCLCWCRTCLNRCLSGWTAAIIVDISMTYYFSTIPNSDKYFYIQIVHSQLCNNWTSARRQWTTVVLNRHANYCMSADMQIQLPLMFSVALEEWYMTNDVYSQPHNDKQPREII